MSAPGFVDVPVEARAFVDDDGKVLYVVVYVCNDEIIVLMHDVSLAKIQPKVSELLESKAPREMHQG